MSSTEAGPPSTVGAGRYTLGDLIGRGGAAEVYRARDELLGRDVAVKLFPAGVGEADESRRQREVQTLAGMNHPGLVTIYDVGAEGSRAYFVMQLIEGESLADRIRSGPLRPGDVVALGAALGDALTYVHRHGVVHRDIKPGNVLLDTEGRPHLSDFGIAVLADATNITATGMVIGTASYLSPEQVRGQPVGPASDVYALGLVLLECITARREYPGNALEAAVARLHRPPDVPTDLPPALYGLLVAMTRDEPAERPTTEQVVGELRTISREVGMDAETVLAPAPTTGTGATYAMGPPMAPPGTGATYAMNQGAPPGYDPYGATQRVGTPPGGYPPYGYPGTDGRTAVVGPGTMTGGPYAPEERRRSGRGPIIAAIVAVLLVAAGVGAYALFGNTTAETPAPAPTSIPAPVETTTTTTTEEETSTRRRTTTTVPPTTTVVPPPVTTTVAPPPVTTTDAPTTTTTTPAAGGGNTGGGGLFPGQNGGFRNGGQGQGATGD
ncbi:serine/threonine-protein kinase [Actinomycetospora sp. NBRC 106378]|uniref:serine/threonine-protein kinase n=1 Tax=Actinomycetospora sp. NBRC 106378 TaxID=3032208 RepID=UPI0024A10C40|nr:serine/threonine-protein kinase [Actinomycetospora sp. NBRC 106378]GLZ56141.1 hypothetical protein Acsp07_57580 [Actinomycetospora sp. NBRC 106378]